jgi:hypothetical protein
MQHSAHATSSGSRGGLLLTGCETLFNGGSALVANPVGTWSGAVAVTEGGEGSHFVYGTVSPVEINSYEAKFPSQHQYGFHMTCAPLHEDGRLWCAQPFHSTRLETVYWEGVVGISEWSGQWQRVDTSAEPFVIEAGTFDLYRQ